MAKKLPPINLALITQNDASPETLQLMYANVNVLDQRYYTQNEVDEMIGGFNVISVNSDTTISAYDKVLVDASSAISLTISDTTELGVEIIIVDATGSFSSETPLLLYAPVPFNGSIGTGYSSSSWVTLRLIYCGETSGWVCASVSDAATVAQSIFQNVRAANTSYYVDYNYFAPTLSALVPGYISEIPPIADTGPIQYWVQGDGDDAAYWENSTRTYLGVVGRFVFKHSDGSTEFKNPTDFTTWYNAL